MLKKENGVNKMINFENLNPMQKKAVLQIEGPVLVLAGAGSGKTGALTVRIAHLIDEGIRPWNILAITFTNKAAREMKERVNALIGRDAEDIWISTFHSTCVRILRRDIDRIGFSRSFSIYDSDDQEKAMKEAFKQLNFSITDKTFTVKAAMAEISSQKDELISPEDYAAKSGGDLRKEKFAKVYSVYQRILKQSNALDFDDLIYKTVLLFRTCPDILERYQEKFRYIMVDEYQDTNTSQYELVRLLASKYGNLCVVGDDDQSIYSWRGANIRNILDFEKDFPSAVVIKLEQNYRSTKTILDAANAVIHNNVARKEKSLWTENEVGKTIHICRTETEQEEARFVCEKIEEYVKNGRSYSDFAMLYRTNAQSRALEDQLVKHSIPYRLFGGTRFYERKEIRDILSYLKVINNPSDDIAMRRIINVPKRGIGDTSVERVSDYAKSHEMSFFDALDHLDELPELKTRAKKLREFSELLKGLRMDAETMDIVNLMDNIFQKTQYIRELTDEGTEEALGRIENLDEFVNKAMEFKKASDDPSLAAFLEDVSLVADVDSFTEGENTVVLMTIHSAKGLEFPYVFMCGMEEGVFPSYRSIMYGGPNEIEEERRLCYVGITRARVELYMTYAKCRMQHGMTQYSSPSRFLKEVPQNLIDEPIKRSAVIKPTTHLSPKRKVFEKPSPYGGIFSAEKRKDIPAPLDTKPVFVVGDKVRAPKYGIGTVTAISPAGADYEIGVTFQNGVVRKFMSKLSKLIKVD